MSARPLGGAAAAAHALAALHGLPSAMFALETAAAAVPSQAAAPVEGARAGECAAAARGEARGAKARGAATRLALAPSARLGGVSPAALSGHGGGGRFGLRRAPARGARLAARRGGRAHGAVGAAPSDAKPSPCLGSALARTIACSLIPARPTRASPSPSPRSPGGLCARWAALLQQLRLHHDNLVALPDAAALRSRGGGEVTFLAAAVHARRVAAERLALGHLFFMLLCAPAAEAAKGDCAGGDSNGGGGGGGEDGEAREVGDGRRRGCGPAACPNLRSGLSLLEALHAALLAPPRGLPPGCRPLLRWGRASKPDPIPDLEPRPASSAFASRILTIPDHFPPHHPTLRTLVP